MKKLIMAGLLLVSGMAHADQYPENPDRRPSLGLNVITSSGDGTSTARDIFGATADQDVENSSVGYAFDIKFPISNNVTLSAHITKFSAESEAETTPILFGGETKTDGYDLGFGVRFYLK